MTLKEKFFLWKSTRDGRPLSKSAIEATWDVDHWSSSQLAEYNFQQRQQIVTYAYENSPFYRSYYDAMNFHPEMLKSEEDWTKVPIITKQDLRDNFQQIIVESQRKYGRIGSTGGSTGKPLKVLKDKRVNNFLTISRALHWYDISFAASKVIVGRNVKSPSVIKQIAKEFVYPTKSIALDASSVDAQNIEALIKKINFIHPEYICGYVGTILEIARYVVNNNKKVHPLKLAWITSAPISMLERDVIKKAFHCDIMDQYGSVEVACLGFESPEHIGLYVPTDIRHLEIVDDENRPVGTETLGNIVVTDLQNRVFPIIRYKNADRTKFLNAKGRLPYPLIDSIKGRISDYVKTPNGIIVSGEYLTTIFDDYPDEVVAFQVVQNEDYSIVVKLCPNLNCQHIDRIVEKVRQNLVNKTKGEIPVEIKIVDEIVSDRGKTRYVINHLKQK